MRRGFAFMRSPLRQGWLICRHPFVFAAPVIIAAALVVFIWILAPPDGGTLRVRAAGWSNTTFLNSGPYNFLPSAYARSPEARIWRNWPPPATSTSSYIKGEVWSDPFLPSAIIGVPVGGSVRPERGNRALIECTTDRRQRPVAEIDVFAFTSLALVDTRGFCDGPIRVGAMSEGRAVMMLGTPMEITSGQAAAARYLVPVLGAVLACTAFLLIWVAASLATARVVEDRLAAPIFGLLSTGVAAIASFWAFSLSPASGMGALSAAAAAALLVIAFASRDRVSTILRSLAAPVGAWLTYSLLVLSLGQAIDNGGSYTAANTMFSPAAWSTDNLISALVAGGLAHGSQLSELGFGSWLVSDRPPLLAGYLLFVENLLAVAVPENLRFTVLVAEQAAGVMVMSLWVPATWLGLRLLGLREKFILFLVCVSGFTGFAIFNSLYIWPKLSAGGFGLLMILSLSALRDQSHGAIPLLCIAALSASLSLLSHGGSIFGVVATLLIFAPAILRQGLRPIVLSGTVGAAVLGSWLLWQDLFQPGGNALARFALVGNFGFDHRDVSVLHDVIDTYGRLTVNDFLQMKLHALLELVGAVPNGCGPPSVTFAEAGIGLLRFHEFFHLAYVVALPAVAASVCMLFRSDRARRRYIDPFARLLVISFVTLVVWLLVTWNCHIVHHFSYQAILATFIGCWGIAFIANRNVAAAFAAASASFTFVVWVVDPLSQAIAVRWLWLLIFAALLAVAGLLCSAILFFDPYRAQANSLR